MPQLTAAAATPLPAWLTRRAVLAVLVAVLLLLWAAAAAFVALQRDALSRQALQSTGLQARLLEDQVSRSLAVTEVALTSLGDSIDPADLAMPAGRRTAEGMLGRTVRLLPFLRSISVVDAEGRILLSSNPRQVDSRVSPAAVDLHGRPGLGELRAGRDLSDLTDAARPRADAPHTLLPLWRPIRQDEARPGLRLVAALSPDFFANQFALLLADEARQAALLTWDGHAVTATPGLALGAGVAAAEGALFRQLMPQREAGSGAAQGLAGGPVMASFRAVRGAPLLVSVEQSRQAAFAPLDDALRGCVAAALVVSLMLCGGCLLLLQGLSRHGEMNRQLLAAGAERARADRELRLLIEGVHEGLFRTDATGRVTFVNPRWRQLSQRGDDEVLGRPIADWVDEADRDRVHDLFDASRREGDGRPAAVQMRLRTARGEPLVMELDVTPLREADGRLTGFAGFAVDVSAREQARRSLQEQLDFTALLIEANPMPIFVKDTQGTYLTANRAFARLHGLMPHQVSAGSVAPMYPWIEGSERARTELQVLSQREPLTYDAQIVREDGSVRDLQITKVRFNGPDGRAAGIIGSMVDVTDFREAERRTRLAQQAADAANHARAEFIANITHELRTPLQSIIGFSELGEGRAEGQDRLVQMFARINGAGQRMLDLVSNLLDISKMESGVGTVELRPADVRLQLGEVLAEFEVQLESTQVRLLVSEPDEPCVAAIDPLRFQQVVRNIVANALRYAPGGTAIEVTISPEAATADLADRLEVTIRDNGPGIPEAELERIFEPFVQSSRTKTGAGGTGLGLAICRKIMQAHRGSVHAFNDPRGGASFVLRLPALPASALPGELDVVAAAAPVAGSTARDGQPA